MSAVENIFGMVILVAIFLIASFVLTSDQISQDIEVLQTETQLFYIDKYSSDLDTLLKATEPVSGRSLGLLIGDTVYYKTKVFDFQNYSVNITTNIEAILNYTYGEGGYYFELKPDITDIRMYFVLDGSRTMINEKDQLVEALESLIERLEERYTVDTRVYILPFSFDCEAFWNEGIPCDYITSSIMYTNPEEINFTVNFSQSAFEEEPASAIDKDYARQAGIIAPEGYFFSYEDWGSATALVAAMEERDRPSRITIIFPISDELSGGSERSDCGDAWRSFPDLDPEDLERKQAIIEMCGYCVPSCPGPSENRSMFSLENALRLAQEKRFYISPIFADNCDFTIDVDIYTNHHLPCMRALETGAASCCGDESYCLGCPSAGGGVCVTDGCKACIHPECVQNIRDQMEYVAKKTSGTVINLEELDTLELYLNETLNTTIESFSIILGEQKNTTRLAYDRILQLPNQFSIKAKLWVYPEEENLIRPSLEDTVFGKPEPALKPEKIE
ncbi:MAG: VWA domain-containing protein [Candidatus Altiarchaeota archaeon]|nr:VWA domain-containing protein [Candidatus Altiarchaeota archaeon]